MSDNGYSEKDFENYIVNLPIVHFAVDTANASMTTKLSGFGTNFLTFNFKKEILYSSKRSKSRVYLCQTIQTFMI